MPIQADKDTPLLVFQLTNSDGRVINIYSNGFINGDGAAEFNLVRN
ncbi:hypothetical protein V1481_01905 [Aeromonas enteropelogenes]